MVYGLLNHICTLIDISLDWLAASIYKSDGELVQELSIALFFLEGKRME
jgi:hypothetical protein